jgi:hypothetical protein
MRQGRDHDNDPAKERKLSAAVYVAQSVALICTLCFCAASAFAADLPTPALIPSPAFPPAVYNWTGFYVGGNLGAGWSGLSDANTNFSDTLGSTFSAGTDAQFLGGGQVGVNYQFANGIVARPCLIGPRTAKTPSSPQLIPPAPLPPVWGRRTLVG